LLWQAQARDLSGPADRSTYGLTTEGGVLLLDVPAASDAAKARLQKDDVISACNGKEVKSIADITAMADQAAAGKLALTINRQQALLPIDLLNYTYVVVETLADTGFKEAPVASAIVPAKVSSGGPRTVDGPLEALIDGKVGKGGTPIYQNGVTDGAYKLDLGESKSVAQVNTFSSSGRNRAKQNFILYGSNAAADPGWNVADAAVFAPIMAVDTREVEPQDFEVTSVRRSDGKPLGAYRWLVWTVSPITGEIGGENSAYQELQVIPGR
jgi:hypothetical protein